MHQKLPATPINFLKGVGPKRAELFQNELDIHTFQDLLTHFPFRYVDRTKFFKISEISSDLPFIQIKGQIISAETVGKNRGKRLVALLKDDTGAIELVWFQGIRWILPSLKRGVDYVVFGKPNLFKGRISISHPEMDIVAEDTDRLPSALQAVYSTTEKLGSFGLNSKGIAKLVKELLISFKENLPETLSRNMVEKCGLMPREEAFINIHIPANNDLLRSAIYRLKFEELFFIQLHILRSKELRKKNSRGFNFSVVGHIFNTFYKEVLPFELTDAQKRVIKEIRSNVGSGQQMNRLLQGDVGSGKTIVALMVMLIALDNGFQSCIMAPTEILANQHYESIKSMLSKLGVETALLTSSVKASARKPILERLLTGELKILVGTHALIEDKVQFKNLGLVIIDEQHRFGVEQRARLWKKNEVHPPHILVMTATPIPRTLAMTLYGDLDISVIDEMPPGRKPVKTIHRFDDARLKVFGFLKDQIRQGRQVYVVYPLIKESEKMDYKDLMDGYESIVRAFPLPEYKVSIMHGQMKPAAKDFEMQRFVKGETQIMVATNVIEVGVDVANATVMVIESAERFGLSQLHQLRGRVGRGAGQSYCLLMTGPKLSGEGSIRMETLVRTGDGFEIADVDLKLRGPGDIEGTQQSGAMDLKLADLAKDGQLIQFSRDRAIELLKIDPDLQAPENAMMAERLAELNRYKKDWSRIS